MAILLAVFTVGLLCLPVFQKLARGLLALMGLGLIYLQVRKGGLEGHPGRRMSSWQRPLLAGVLAFSVAALAVTLLGGIVLGLNGVDFAIFSQAIHNIGHRGVPWVTLPGGGERNFLTHHLVPFLYVPGLLNALGLSAPLSGVLVHVAGYALLGVAFHSLYRAVGLPRGTAVLLTGAALLTPSLRAPFFWTMNDELFGAPFLALGFAFWLRGKPGWSAISFAICCLCKESYSLTVLAAVTVALLWHTDFRPLEERRRARSFQLALGAFALLIAAGYFFLQPLLLHKSFDHAGKLMAFAEWRDPEMLGGKLKYLFWLALATLGIPLLESRSRKMLLVAGPAVLLSLVSNFSQMWVPFNYYAATPIIVALGLSFRTVERLLRPGAQVMVLGVLWVLSLCFCPMNFAGTVQSLVRTPWRSAAQLSWLPQDAEVLADPAAALFLLDHPRLTRVWTVPGLEAAKPFQYIVVKPSGFEPVPEDFLRRSEPCHTSELWAGYCAKTP